MYMYTCSRIYKKKKKYQYLSAQQVNSTRATSP